MGQPVALAPSRRRVAPADRRRPRRRRAPRRPHCGRRHPRLALRAERRRALDRHRRTAPDTDGARDVRSGPPPTAPPCPNPNSSPTSKNASRRSRPGDARVGHPRPAEPQDPLCPGSTLKYHRSTAPPTPPRTVEMNAVSPATGSAHDVETAGTHRRSPVCRIDAVLAQSIVQVGRRSVRTFGANTRRSCGAGQAMVSSTRRRPPAGRGPPGGNRQ